MGIGEILSTTGISFLTLSMYIVFLVGLPFFVSYTFKTILKLTKYKKKADNIFWVVFIVLLALWNGLIFFLEIFR
jgi:hypothetical protein